MFKFITKTNAAMALHKPSIHIQLNSGGLQASKVITTEANHTLITHFLKTNLLKRVGKCKVLPEGPRLLVNLFGQKGLLFTLLVGALLLL